MHTYIDEEGPTAKLSGIVRDYNGEEYEVHEQSTTHLEKSEYSISIADEYLRLCANYGLFNLFNM